MPLSRWTGPCSTVTVMLQYNNGNKTTNDMKKINFKQSKYILPIGVYLLALFIGYQVIRLFTIEVEDKGDASLVTTDYLNGELPSANVSDRLGSKRENMQHSFGYITDNSAVENIVDDTDSLRRKEDYSTQYTDEERAALERQAKEAEDRKRYEELQARLQGGDRQGPPMGAGDFVLPMSDEEREHALQSRRSREMEEMEAALGLARSQGRGRLASPDDVLPADTVTDDDDDVVGQADAVAVLDDDAESQTVVKKRADTSDYFNTLSENAPESHLIKAIIDEEVKATEGSRVRLRLLDDIEVGDIPMKKGSYLYATMSGFSKQRAKGKVESIMVGDELFKVGLTIFDTDGLEGLYVPGSQFMETVKDVGGSAMQTNMNLNDGGSNGNNVEQWAMQGLQNAYRRTSNAISKAIKKNRVRLKYGTQVYLVNSKDKKKR